MRRVELTSVALVVERQGKGEPLLLLHDGGSTATHDFGPLIPHLARRHDVIAPDLRGHGGSTAVSDAVRFSWPAIVRDLKELLDTLAIERATVAGVGDGATAALQLAIRQGERVNALVAAGARSHVGDDDILRLDALRPQNLRAGAPSVAERLARLHGSGWETLMDRYVASFRIDRAFLDARHDAKKVSCPTLLFHGANDPLTPASHAETLAAAIPGSRLALVDAGRAVQKTAEFAERLAGFKPGISSRSS